MSSHATLIDEITRLRAVNKELVAACKAVLPEFDPDVMWQAHPDQHRKAEGILRAAIDRAEGGG